MQRCLAAGARCISNVGEVWTVLCTGPQSACVLAADTGQPRWSSLDRREIHCPNELTVESRNGIADGWHACSSA